MTKTVGASVLLSCVPLFLCAPTGGADEKPAKGPLIDTHMQIGRAHV